MQNVLFTVAIALTVYCIAE